MNIQDILNRLHKVRKGADGYLACCPAHDDRNPSMTIKQCEDGRILMHCFSNKCSIDDICGALGIDVSDLFPERPTVSFSRDSWNARDILAAVSHELCVVGVAVADVQAGKKLSRDDYARFLVAVNRLQVAKDMACQ